MPSPAFQRRPRRSKRVVLNDTNLRHYIGRQYNHGVADVVEVGTKVVGGAIRGISSAIKKHKEKKHKEKLEKNLDNHNRVISNRQKGKKEAQESNMKKHFENVEEGFWDGNKIDQMDLLLNYGPGQATINYVWIDDPDYYGYYDENEQIVNTKDNDESGYIREVITNNDWQKEADDYFIDEDEEAEANGNKVEYYKEYAADGKVYSFRKETYTDEDGKEHAHTMRIAEIGSWMTYDDYAKANDEREAKRAEKKKNDDPDAYKHYQEQKAANEKEEFEIANNMMRIPNFFSSDYQ